MTLSVPELGAHTSLAAFSGESPPRGADREGDSSDRLPLAGLRILDLTAWWAGPAATHILATFGAEVIRVESIGRPDGLRMVGRTVMICGVSPTC